MSTSYLEVTWTDDETGIHGYVVIDRLSRGIAGGGLRMRKGVTLDEVRDLARGMTLKDPMLWVDGDRYVPFGGAKGGIDCDPYDPRAREVLGRFARAIKPLLDSLDFSAGIKNWGYQLRFGLFAISEHDWRLIAEAMGARMPAAA